RDLESTWFAVRTARGSGTTQQGETTVTSEHDAATYDVDAIQDKWRRVWDELQPFETPPSGGAGDETADDDTRERRYLLTMFPYPSGDLHMGHGEVFAVHDMLVRDQRMRGYNVHK